jgi:hypothetical protein
MRACSLNNAFTGRTGDGRQSPGVMTGASKATYRPNPVIGDIASRFIHGPEVSIHGPEVSALNNAHAKYGQFSNNQVSNNQVSQQSCKMKFMPAD